jgi:gas vesicle protein
MSDKNPSSGRGIMMAAVVGAAVGAGVALLFAPGSGKETRGWLAHRTRKLKDATVTAYAESKDTIQRAAKTIGSDGEGTTASHGRPMYGKSGAPPTRS